MSLPDLAPTPSFTRPDATALTAILNAAAQHRLHAAIGLVGVHRVPAPVVLDLTWRQSVRVFVDETGRPYSEANADEAVTVAAAKAGLLPPSFAGLRECRPRRPVGRPQVPTDTTAGVLHAVPASPGLVGASFPQRRHSRYWESSTCFLT